MKFRNLFVKRLIQFSLRNVILYLSMELAVPIRKILGKAYSNSFIRLRDINYLIENLN